jgi:TatA/E family protein of Tat protein translocase
VLSHWPYLIILAVIALIIFGPRRLPELGEGLGKAIKEFRKATSEMGDSLRDETSKSDSATGTTYTAPVVPVAPVEPVVPAAASTAPPPAVPSAEPPKS